MGRRCNRCRVTKCIERSDCASRWRCRADRGSTPLPPQAAEQVGHEPQLRRHQKDAEPIVVPPGAAGEPGGEAASPLAILTAHASSSSLCPSSPSSSEEEGRDALAKQPVAIISGAVTVAANLGPSVTQRGQAARSAADGLMMVDGGGGM